MNNRVSIISLLALAAAIYFSGCTSTTSKPISTAAAQPTPMPYVPVEGWVDVEVHSVPEGAEIFTPQNTNLGQTPVTIRTQVFDDKMAGPNFLTAIPTAPGQYTQHIWFGRAGSEPPANITIYMYNNGTY
jgi:hypothetical protein